MKLNDTIIIEISPGNTFRIAEEDFIIVSRVVCGRVVYLRRGCFRRSLERFAKKKRMTEGKDVCQEEAASTKKDASFTCGMITGVFVAGLFNPYDRALYLSVKERRPFRSRQNFVNPYRGFLQTVGIRAFSGGLWFPLEHYFAEKVKEISGGMELNWLAGSLAGSFEITYPRFPLRPSFIPADYEKQVSPRLLS